jgi:hypothetical protein
MFAIRGDAGSPDVALERVRRRVRSRLPFVVERASRLLHLASIGAQGPDPEAALEQLRAADRTLAAFLKTTR